MHKTKQEGFLLSKKLKIEGNRKKQKWHLLSSNNDFFENEIINGPNVQILGNSKIIIEGCYGVFEYRDTYLRLRLKKGSLVLCGENFDIIFFENRAITVKGKISSVEFCV